MTRKQESNHVYETPQVQPDLRDTVTELKKLVYILMALVMLSTCIALVSLTVGALAFSLTKDCNNAASSPSSSSTDDVKHENVSPSSSTTQQAQQLELNSLLRNTVFFVTYKQWETNTPDGATMLWDDVRIDPGNNYDNVTGAYTAPYDGYYQFSITKRSQGNWGQFLTYVDGMSVHHCWDGDNYVSSQTSCTIVIKLLAGQIVQIRNIRSTVTQSFQMYEDWTAVNSWFAGHMLSPL